ncbi:hypothetical protein EUX98_g9798, partial [Antrodiella citrinella]
FVSKFLHALYTLLGIQGNPSTAYHPQTDGQTERVNQEVEQYLRTFINHRQDDWAEWLPIAEFCYNDRVNKSTGHSPFFLNNGYHPWKGTTPRREVRNETAQEFVDRLTKVRDEADTALRLAQEQMARFYDRKRGDAREYQPGDLVWLEGTNVRTDRPTKKLEDRRYGPFKIIKKIGASAYKLDLPRKWRAIHPVVNESTLTPYVAPAFPSQSTTKPAEYPTTPTDETNHWIVEEVINSRYNSKDKLQYHVKYKGRPRSEWEWIPAGTLKTYAREQIDDFHRHVPSAPRPLATIRLPPRRQENAILNYDMPFRQIVNFTTPTLPTRLFNWEDGRFELSSIARTRFLKGG